MSGRPDPFWLCHECRAEMRPVTRDGVPHCASCDGEFIEILDPNENPDPYHELPPPPPLRPQSSPPIQFHPDAHDAHAHQDGGGFFQSLMGNFFGAAMDQRQDHTEGNRPASMPASPGPLGRNTGGQGRGGAAGGSGLRTWEFNIGGGRGSIQFGTIGGMGPFGPTGGNDDRGLDDFFPGFAVPPNAEARRPFNPYATRNQQGQEPGQGGPASMEELLQGLMGMLANDGMMPGMGGPRGQANFGDYVMTQHGFDEILEQLMHAAGPQGPIPASDVVIEGLPRFSLTEELLEKSQFKDCPVCKDDFSIGEEVMKIPCGHLFHPGCLQPWLKTNGSCPVCRFSLVPDESNTQPQQPQQASATAPPAPSSPQTSESPNTPYTNQPSGEGTNIFTNVLQRLWGQSGSSNPSSPITETGPGGSSSPFRPSSSRTQSGTVRSTVPPTSATHSGANRSTEDISRDDETAMSSAIPEDYRERHRQRELQQQQQQQQQQTLRQRPPPPEDDYPSYFS